MISLKLNKRLLKVLKKIGKFIPYLEPYIYKISRNNSPMSKGEVFISNWLKDNNINYKREFLVRTKQIVKQKKFLFVDFYLPDYKVFIEYNGRQHYEYVPYFHKTEKDFHLQQARDCYLRDYSKNKGITLLEISYTMRYKDIDKLLCTQLLQKTPKVR